MNWFVNLSLRGKVAALFGFIAVFFFSVVLYSYKNINQVRLDQKELADKYSQIQTESLLLKEVLSSFKVSYLDALLRGDREAIKELSGKFDECYVSASAILKKISNSTQNENRYIEDVNAILINLGKWRNEVSVQIAYYASSKPSKNVDSLFLDQSTYQKMQENALQIWNISQKDLADGFLSSNDQIVKTIMIFFGAGILFFFAGIYVLKQSNKFLADPLLRVAEASEQIAAGDIYQELPEVHRKDEIGKLYSAFETMLASLKEIANLTDAIAQGSLTVHLVERSDKDVIVQSLNTMIVKLRQVISEIKQGSDVVSGSANRIFGAVTQLSTASNQTATAIGETTVTIEEVKKTSEMLSRKAREISNVAQKASAISESGMRTTEETIQGIQNIGNQMEIIGESIIKLSEQSRAIGDIIASVNDLAEQSNLLAVNAAIEAARAGEHGKSFVVVAQEIKSLAQQSKNSTAQVKSVLNDIQNAINATVLATEQGEKIVNAGIARSQETRESIQTLADTITMFTDISMQTSASSQEQYIGMEQVAIAMDNIKVASTQNALITKEMEQSARNLQMLTDRLKDAIAIFKVE